MSTPSEEAAAQSGLGRQRTMICNSPTRLCAVKSPRLLSYTPSMRSRKTPRDLSSSVSFDCHQDACDILAPELWLHIFSFLPASTLACVCASVCRSFATLALEAIKEREFAQHETFMLTLARYHVGSERYCRWIDEHISKSDVPLVIAGESGGGKSSLLIQWIMRYHQKRADTLFLYHFVGSAAHSTDYTNVLHRFMSELKRDCNIHEDVPCHLTNLQKKFPQWLGEAGAKRQVILIIDGLGQFDDKEDSHNLHWLPEHFPSNVKVILSTVPGECLEICTQKRGWKSLVLQPLSRDEKAMVIRQALGEKQVTLTQSQQERIFNAPQTTNPLFLTVLLEYLPGFGNQNEIETDIDFYLQAEDATDLFVKIIDRLEKTFQTNNDPYIVRDILTCLYMSRLGLSETELQEVLDLDFNSWSRFYHAVAPSLVIRFGLLNFYHDRFRQAVATKFLQDSDLRMHCLQKLGRYFQQKLNDGNITMRVVDELPWILEKAGDSENLKDCITHIKLFDRLFQKERKYDLFRYWVSVNANGTEISQLYWRKLNEFQRVYLGSMKEVARLAHKIGEYIRDGGHYNEAVHFFNKALEIKKAEYGSDAVEVATTMNELGRLYFRLGRNEETLAIWKRALEIREIAKCGKEDHDIAISLNNLALIYEKMGRWQEAEPTYLRALEIYKKVSGPEHPDVAITYHNLGLLYSSNNSRLADSEEMYMKALAIKEKYYGKNHNELAMTLNNLGLVYSKGMQHTKAVELYKKAIEIRETIFGPDHPDVALFLFNLGVCYGKLNMLDQAKPCLFRALKIRKRVYGTDHNSTQVVRSWVHYFNWQEEEEL